MLHRTSEDRKLWRVMTWRTQNYLYITGATVSLQHCDRIKVILNVFRVYVWNTLGTECTFMSKDMWMFESVIGWIFESATSHITLSCQLPIRGLATSVNNQIRHLACLFFSLSRLLHLAIPSPPTLSFLSCQNAPVPFLATNTFSPSPLTFGLVRGMRFP